MVAAKRQPVVIITSNSEKELPDAFLRRCVFHWIDFPDQELMSSIVQVHHPDIERELLAFLAEKCGVEMATRWAHGLRQAGDTLDASVFVRQYARTPNRHMDMETETC